MFRTITLGVSALSILATPIAVAAKDKYEVRESKEELKQERRELRDARKYGDRRDIREERRDVREARGELQRDRADWRSYLNYDYNRPAQGYNTYYADQYYRDGQYYQPRRLASTDRIYRGRDNRYYCRRPDGTTGLIIGAIGGGVLGGAIASGGSNTLGVILGALGGGVLGRSIDRNNVRCR